MKRKFNLRSAFRLIVAIVLINFCVIIVVYSQKKDEVKDFLISIEWTDKGFKLESYQGSAWIKLGFSFTPYKPQAVDENGMTQLSEESNLKDENLADYLFTITKTDDGVTLKGIEGVHWKELKFSLPKHKQQKINQFGMVM